MNIKSWLEEFVGELKGDEPVHYTPDFRNGEVAAVMQRSHDDDGNLTAWDRETHDQNGQWRRVRFEVVQDD